MFRIKKVTLFKETQEKDYAFSDNAYVYGHNSVGKTALTKIIDFVLGSSEPLIHDGLDNLDGVGAYIENNKTQLWLKRNFKGNFFYKRTETSDYSCISYEKYKETICEIINNNQNTKTMEVYQKVFEETPTYRSFSFINFVDEIGQGDLSNIFTRGKEIKHLVRIRNIMDFFFNYENIEKIYEKSIALEKVESDLKKYNDKINQYQYCAENIHKHFTELGLKYSEDMTKNYDIFKDFKNSFNRKEEKSNGDLIYLTRASYSLSEEIKLYTYLTQQSKETLTRKQRTELLLTILMSIIAENDEYAEDVNSITKIIREIQNDKLILSLVDYETSIKKINNEKKKIDSKIELLKQQSSEVDYDKALKLLTLLEDYFSTINIKIDFNKVDRLKKEANNLKKQIKELKNNYSQNKINDFNKSLTDMYLNSNVKNVPYLNDDRKEEDFCLSFDPFSQNLVAKHKESDIIVTYTPGSMARHNHLQLLVYLCMLEFLHNNFNNFIYLPILIVDSADQAMDDKSFEELYPSLISIAKNIGIQTIFLSKFKPKMLAREDFLDISTGLNPFHS